MGGSAAALLLAIYALIAAAVDADGVIEYLAATASLQIKLLLSIVKLLAGIIIYKSKSGVSVLSAIIICFFGLVSVIDCFVNPSFISEFIFMIMFLPIMAMLRQFCDKRRQTK